MAAGEVVVVGAGPTGLMLACELALGGAQVTVLEERTSTPNITRAFEVHAIDNRPELPDAVLVRPDGYAAWASERLPHAAEVRAAIIHWMSASE
ncbi:MULTISPECIES: FAD-dependent monooxygenase [Mycolicibacterium]|uniref:2-polyprenyl-6-methoxyphenol hydroxylase-like oxidoreductase n=1 Tax=Mycolicibacterium senegalense TaxID=1796 RepID=A0A378W4V7_9MYCO|nr:MULTISPECIES: FAD-dependent monooxygenase [Mycolicibacterium]MDR7288349.1 glycine/D-amino acid oxidase-like deaminating enzyme [Mycolicibacterium senegalense]CDP85695.1 2-polyprenyl-6-methoxyphenol hydroxylase-like oxidoreductase [Mycolicibacterium farcinogenes]SUA28075.1 2-polyprenyl-6-methoxyphenol hydroxylase-like oxidoreductase [Mycolicibacterium senegalense]